MAEDSFSRLLSARLRQLGLEDDLKSRLMGRFSNNDAGDEFDASSDDESASPAIDNARLRFEIAAELTAELTDDLREAQETGARLQQMIEDPQIRCSVLPSLLTLSSLAMDDWVIHRNHNELQPHGFFCGNVSSALDIPRYGYSLVDFHQYDWPTNGISNLWRGRVAPGVMFIENIERRGRTGPWSSQLMQVAYETVAEISTLRTIFVANVVNRNTVPAAEWVLSFEQVQVCEFDTPEYQLLLGTRIGRVIAYFVLGAYGQGIRRISRIQIWWHTREEHLQMRFDLEDI
ncbi:hypothetical protein N7539_005455 [Penicillium diatomitis]|uniref:Uncharacterized protein n=1 Tax=Penicillium diatomitis TaxID=2819901 RepID=A0A9W9X714_9EURO|nr:uncharacterized protein N7539_005455 [Penicillium diatomitis]KAJ5485467.1 hypothetical protein N7539_005455 [Penicillium diatomitis]